MSVSHLFFATCKSWKINMGSERSAKVDKNCQAENCCRMKIISFLVAKTCPETLAFVAEVSLMYDSSRKKFRPEWSCGQQFVPEERVLSTWWKQSLSTVNSIWDTQKASIGGYKIKFTVEKLICFLAGFDVQSLLESSDRMAEKQKSSFCG